MLPTMTAPQPGQGHNQPETFVFAVYAEAEPDVMPRVLEEFAKRSLVPERWYSTVIDGFGRELQIDVRVSGLEPVAADHLGHCLRRLVHVREVVTARS